MKNNGGYQKRHQAVSSGTWLSRTGVAVKRLMFFIVLLAIFVYSFFPVVWIFLTAFKLDSQIGRWPIEYMPNPFVLDQFTSAFRRVPLLRYTLNSIIVSGIATILCVFVATLASYPLSRLKIRGKPALMAFFVLLSTIPLISMMVPLFEIFRSIGLLNNFQSLIFPYAVFSLPICIWILTAFFREIPSDLEDSAMIDGCTRIGALVKVIFPLSAPGVATATMMAFVNAWNEFTLAFTLITDRMMYTLPVGITLLRDEFAVPWGMIAAGTVVAITPLVIIVIAFQKNLISGLTKGAVKG